MALVSPGVQVTVTDQSYYAPTSVGSVAYILLATEQDKIAPGGVSIAPGTLAENAGSIYNITSQRDLVTTFGTPIFKTTSAGTPINGDERNEYGLMAAYSLLGASNSVYIQRANVDLSQLSGTTVRPLANPDNGALWLDTSNTNWGIYGWNATTQQFALVTPLVINSSASLVSNITPNVGIGSIGQYAVNTVSETNPIFYKTYDNTWQLVGTTGWQSRIPTITSSNTSVSISANSEIIINGTTVVVLTGDNATAVAGAINGESITGVTARVSSAGQVILQCTEDAVSGAIAISNGNNTPLSDIGITIGTYNGPAVEISPYYTVPAYESANLAAGTGRPTSSIWQKASVIGSGLSASVKQYNSASNTWVTKTVNDYANVFVATYTLDPTGGGANLTEGAVFVEYDAYAEDSGTQAHIGSRIWYRNTTGETAVTGSTPSPIAANIGAAFTLTTRATATSAITTTYTVTITTATVAGFVDAVSAASIPNVGAEIASDGTMILTHALGGDMYLTDGAGTPLANVGIDSSATNAYQVYQEDGTAITSVLIGSNWEPIAERDFTASATQVFVAPENDTYWYYNALTRADIMISNGSAWLGYGLETSDIRGYNLAQTDPSGPLFSAAEPTTQSDGTALVYGDLWIDTGDLDNYPALYRFQSVSGNDQWVAINTSDNTGQNGIVFADARWAPDGDTNPVTASIPTISGLKGSSYVDLDAPDPALYPRGMLLWNTRTSGYNVKQFKTNYFTATAYPGESIPTETGTWVSVSGYNTAGVVPNFGRKAQRGVIVSALRSAIDSSTTLREDANLFNIIACPGYPELMPNMVTLNEDRDNTAFVIGDTPMRLPATGTAIQAWANNTAGAVATGEEGLNTSSPYMATYYPSGLTNDLTGNQIAVPPSHAALRTFIKSDNVSYPWLAPAGTRRGLIDNLTAIGYIDSNSGAFITIGVNQGLRDTMYNNKINPFTSLPGTGLVVYGQKTLSVDPSSLDRVNVSRLVNFLRNQLNTISRPFVFEPNDPITRNGLLAVVNSLLNDLIAKRGITDYLTVCDTTNNTPERIARNELYVDIAIQPTKAVEFIYIPIRLKNPGEIQSGNLASATNPGTGA
tara:strand:+ start:3059 stop:6352 length:3294 start_codon:yes stop_codon:yes gene_type:complete